MNEKPENECLTEAMQRIHFLEKELDVFSELAHTFDPPPSELPEVPWIDVYGESLPYNRQAGGDHIIYVDFKKRYKMEKLIRNAPENLKKKLRATAARAGILVLDVEGHDFSSAFIASVFHQAFLLGVSYELQISGEITTSLFENINTRFFNSSGISKTLTMIYGEISEKGTFRFISAAHPPPLVFSNEYNRMVAISEDRLVSFPQIGTMPSPGNSEITIPLLGIKEKYTINEINLMGKGDILILYTDGLSDHRNSHGEKYFPERLEDRLKECKSLPARDIFHCIKNDLLAFHTQPVDDVTFVIIKKI